MTEKLISTDMSPFVAVSEIWRCTNSFMIKTELLIMNMNHRVNELLKHNWQSIWQYLVYVSLSIIATFYKHQFKFSRQNCGFRWFFQRNNAAENCKILFTIIILLMPFSIDVSLKKLHCRYGFLVVIPVKNWTYLLRN